jgi:hypothetical protein
VRPIRTRSCLALGTLLILGGAGLALDRGLAGPPAGAAAFRSVPVVNLGPLPSERLSQATSGGHQGDATGGGDASGQPGSLPAGSTLRLSRLAVNAAISRVAVVAGVMQVPSDPRVVGWWTDSAAPSESQGSVVIVGHVNYSGVAGALGSLPQARIGDEVGIDGPGLTARYRVTAVRTYPKSGGIPAAAFSQQAGYGRLVLITCGGPFDPETGNYEDNIVAYATRS